MVLKAHIVRNKGQSEMKDGQKEKGSNLHCRFCGSFGAKNNRCKRCNRIMTDALKIKEASPTRPEISKPLKELPNRKRNMTSQSGQSNQNSKSVNPSKRYSSKEEDSSSNQSRDSDDSEPDPKKTKTVTNPRTYTTRNKAFTPAKEPQEEMTKKNHLAADDQIEDPQLETSDTEDAAMSREVTPDLLTWNKGGLNGTFFGVSCRSASIGGVKVVPFGRVLFSSEGIVMKLPTMNVFYLSSTTMVVITIAKEDIIILDANLDKSSTALAVNMSLSSSSAAKVCDQLKIGKTSCAEKDNFVTIFLPQGLTDTARNELQKTLNTYSQTSASSADNIPVASQDSDISLKRTDTPAKTYGKKNSKSPFVQHSKKRPSMDSKPAVESKKPPKKSSPTVHMFNWTDESDSFSINTDDYNCLNQEEFLNDNVVDFYLRYVFSNKLEADVKSRSHVFSTFFYQRLSSRPQNGRNSGVEDDPSVSAAEKQHSRVKSWTKKVDIFEKDFLFIPINERSHWYLAIVCFPGLTGPVTVTDNRPVKLVTKSSKAQKVAIDVDDGDDESDVSMETIVIADENCPDSHEPIKQPCILICDSLSGSNHGRVIATLRNYLRVEYQVKKGSLPPALFTRESMVGSCLKVPQQNNHWDCGVYVLQYAEAFMKKPLRDYRLPLASLHNWFPGCVASRKRKDIQHLMIQLTQNLNPIAADSVLKMLPPTDVRLASGKRRSLSMATPEKMTPEKEITRNESAADTEETPPVAVTEETSPAAVTEETPPEVVSEESSPVALAEETSATVSINVDVPTFADDMESPASPVFSQEMEPPSPPKLIPLQTKRFSGSEEEYNYGFSWRAEDK